MNLLFVCRGNTCRSPMMKFVRDAVQQPNGDVNIARGTDVTDSCISSGAAQAMSERGIAFDSEYVPRAVSRSDILCAEVIVAADASVLARLRQLFPDVSLDGKRVIAADIPDPYGGSREEYSACLKKTEEIVQNI